MSTIVAEIQARIRSLTPEEQAEIIRGLIAELDGPADPEAEREWLKVAQQRHRELIDGSVHPVAGERVFEELASRLRR